MSWAVSAWRFWAWAPSGCSTWRCSGSIRANRPIGVATLAVLFDRASCSSALQLLSLGVLAELVTAYNIRAEDTYSVAETISAPKSDGREPSRERPSASNALRSIRSHIIDMNDSS